MEEKSNEEYRTDNLVMPPPCFCVMSCPDLGCGIGLNIHSSVRWYNRALTVNEGMYNWVDFR